MAVFVSDALEVRGNTGGPADVYLLYGPAENLGPSCDSGHKSSRNRRERRRPPSAIGDTGVLSRWDVV